MKSFKLNKELKILDDFPAIHYEEWKAKAVADLKGVPFEKKLITHLYEGLDLQPIYTAGNWASTNDRSGLPGSLPYTRGMKPLAHTRNGGDIRQEILNSIPAEANAVFLEELKHGATSVELKWDAAACNGLDADNPKAAGLLGREGIMIYHRGDLEQVLENVLLDLAPVSLDAGAAFLPAAALLATQWTKQGINESKVSGSFNADPLGALMLHGTLPVPLDSAIAQMVDLAAWTANKYPKVKATRISTAVYHHAGATSIQDLAYAIGTSVEYLRAMTAAGMDINTAVRQITFHIALDCRFFQGIAKLRALRKLWAKIALACGADKSALTALLITTATSRRVITRRDPWVNLLRNTVACFAGTVGGADSITSLPMDIGLGPSDEFSRHLARNTLLILQEECYLAKVADPAGGSWFLETLTDQLAENAWSLFQKIEAQGGMIKASLSGSIYQQIHTVEQQREKDLATRKVGVTGVSEHADAFEEQLVRPSLDEETLRREALASLLKWRHNREDQVNLETLKSLAAQTSRPLGILTEATFKAASAGATIGELSTSLTAGTESQEIVHIPFLAMHAYAAAFEELRNATDEYAKTHENRRPRVFLANLGTPKEFLARATYASDFFEAGGFEPITTDGFSEPQAVADAYATSGVKIAVICSTDLSYESEVERVAPLLRAAGARTVVLAGNPGVNEMKYRNAGVNCFIFLKCNILDILWGLLQEEKA